jgi:hypothetical protein
VLKKNRKKREGRMLKLSLFSLHFNLKEINFIDLKEKREKKNLSSHKNL